MNEKVETGAEMLDEDKLNEQMLVRRQKLKEIAEKGIDFIYKTIFECFRNEIYYNELVISALNLAVRSLL